MDQWKDIYLTDGPMEGQIFRVGGSYFKLRSEYGNDAGKPQVTLAFIRLKTFRN
jgi:hypothetical protein